ncbi:MAG TPA: hypothetical protein VNA16_05035 [Abditibacteriaceae bacterium]|nr:hypothetical protein [Abditibacteriaceae bacterium]
MPTKRKLEVAETLETKRRKITLIEVLVILMVSAVLIRFVYHIANWHDLVKAVTHITAPEVGTLVVFCVAYCLFNRWIKKI